MKNDIILKALEFYGMEAVEGSTADPRLAEFLERFFNKGFDPETEAWCSAFLNACCKAVGSPLSGSPSAISWLSAGIPTQKPEMGDIAVFWRESPQSGLGHVGIFIRQDGNNIWVLGGDENYAVGILPFPASRSLGFRSLVIA